MELLKNVVNKITGGTKLRKDQLLIMILSGVLLCIIALPVKESNSGFLKRKSDISDKDYDIVENDRQQQDTQSDTYSAEGEYDPAYTAYWERKLKQSLSYLEGAGAVEVLITLKESEERILEKDMPEETSETAEADAEGGSRTIMERKRGETTVFTVNEAGQNVPYVSKIVQPAVEGVVVIAQGGDSEIVKQNIIDAIQVLFGIEANKIRVVKMKTNN